MAESQRAELHLSEGRKIGFGGRERPWGESRTLDGWGHSHGYSLQMVGRETKPACPSPLTLPPLPRQSRLCLCPLPGNLYHQIVLLFPNLSLPTALSAITHFSGFVASKYLNFRLLTKFHLYSSLPTHKVKRKHGMRHV